MTRSHAPIASADTWNASGARKKIELELTLIRTGSTDAIKLARYSEIEGSFTSPRSPHEIAAWFAGAVAKLAPAMLATCALVLPTGEAAGVLFGPTDGNPRCLTFQDTDGRWIQLVDPREQ